MNVYDFDKTIYAGDSTIDFYLFCLQKHPSTILSFSKQAYGAFLHSAGKMDTKTMKEYFFSFLPGLKDPYALTELFWKTHWKKIKTWYLRNKNETDVIISASPDFLLKPICVKLGVARPIATQIDIHSGKIKGQNCKGQEKVRRFFERYPEEKIDIFYSDSLTDTPLADIAQKAVMVKGNKLSPWPKADVQQK